MSFEISRKSLQWEPNWYVRTDRRTIGNDNADSHSSPLNTGLFISPWNILKIRNKWTTQRIVVILTPIERENLQVFILHILHILQMFNMSTFGNAADIYATVHPVPHACQHITVDQSHSSGDTVAKIWRLAGNGDTKTVSFTNPQKKKSHGVKSGDRGGHRINAPSSFPVRPIHPCGKFRLRYPRTSLW